MTTCLPQPFVDRIHSHFGPQSQQILESFNHKRFTSVRVNALRASKDEVADYLRGKHIPYKLVDAIPEAFILEELSSREVTQLSFYTEGKIYIQSLSSMLPVLILDPQPGEEVLDVAAAPGSKTSHIAAYTANHAKITANDIDRKRLFKLKAILENQGTQNVTLTNLPGQTIWQKYPEYFDKVLLDAPCSMEGRFDCADKSSYEHWSLRKVKNLARLQQWLLRSTVSSTKVGGTIVYSTCTLSPEENEGVINWILEKEKGVVALEKISLPGIKMMDGFIEFENKRYSGELTKTKRVFPSEFYEGFYIAKLKKVASNVKRQVLMSFLPRCSSG